MALTCWYRSTLLLIGARSVYERVEWGTPMRPKKGVTGAVRWKTLASEPGSSDTANQLAKQRRALLESNPPRDNQPETHPHDEPRGEGR